MEPPTPASPATFDPSRYVTKLGPADYLEVKWRLVWLRELHPAADVQTELVSHADQMAIFRARVSIPGGGSATGYGSEAADDFREYIEKAETKAVGRALAALGFGTQFCGEADPAIPARPANGRPATPKQRKFLRDLANLTDAELDPLWQRKFGHGWEQAQAADVSELIQFCQGGGDLVAIVPAESPVGVQPAPTGGVVTPSQPERPSVVDILEDPVRQWAPGQKQWIEKMILCETVAEIEEVQGRLIDMRERGHKGALVLLDLAALRKEELEAVEAALAAGGAFEDTPF